MSMFVEYTPPVWRGLNMRELSVDNAYIILTSLYDKVSYLYTLSDECYKCPYTKLKTLHPIQGEQDNNDIETLKLNIAHALKFKLFDKDVGHYAFENETSLCTLYRTDLQEFGVYNLTVNANGGCALVTDKDGVNVNWSILSVFVLVTLALCVLKILHCSWRRYRYVEDELVINSPSMMSMQDENEVTTTATLEPTQRKRMRSLDAFRGMAIVLMIFVNSGAGHYWWMEHAAWNGLTIADIVFPSFLWIMGVCIPISVKSQLGRGAKRSSMCYRIIWRSLKLFAIGLCLNSVNGPNLENLRIMGVLQRFGIAYLICGIVHAICSKKDHIMPQVTWKRAIYDIILLRCEFVAMMALILTYLGITFGLYVPDCPRGYLGPGGKHNYVAAPNCIGGAAGFIDLQIFGIAHIYQHPTAKWIYDSGAFDPEGIFGCLLTIVQVLFGLLAGVIILVYKEWRMRIMRWMIWCLLLALLGGILCMFSQENGVIPVNKNLWSLSFVCVTSSLAFLLLSILYFIIDVQQWWSGYPFVESGMNAIIMYVGHTVMHRILPWHWSIGAMNTHFVLLLESTWNTLLWIGIALYLDTKQFYYSL